jgi:O-antigen ligase
MVPGCSLQLYSRSAARFTDPLSALFATGYFRRLGEETHQREPQAHNSNPQDSDAGAFAPVVPQIDMIQQIATIVTIAGIVWLFVMDRDGQAQTSKALWISMIWLLIVGSRPTSLWFNVNTPMPMAEQYSEGSPFDATVYGTLIAAGMLTLNRRSNQVRMFIQGNAPILLFFTYCAISILWSDYLFISLKHWIKSIGDVVMVLIVLTDPYPRAAIRRFFSWTAFLLIPISVLLIMFYPSLGRYYDSAERITYYTGVTTNKNSLGVICVVCGLGALWSFIGAYEERKMPHRVRHLIAHGIIFATAAGLIVKADSMTSLSCLVMGGSVMVMATQKWVTERASYIHALVGGAVALPLFAIFLDTAGSLVHALGRNTTLTGRLSIWTAVLSLQTNPLLGTGYESFWLGGRLQRVWDMTSTGIQEAHNGYIEVYLNLGWVGLIMLGSLIITGYRHAYALYCRDPHLGTLRIALLTASVIYGLTEASFRMLSPIWIAFLLAIPYVPQNLQKVKRQRTLRLPLTQIVRSKRVQILQ